MSDEFIPYGFNKTTGKFGPMKSTDIVNGYISPGVVSRPPRLEKFASAVVSATTHAPSATHDGSIILLDASANNIAVNLPASAGVIEGRVIPFMLATATGGAFNITFNRDGTDNILHAGALVSSFNAAKDLGTFLILTMRKTSGLANPQWEVLQARNAPFYSQAELANVGGTIEGAERIGIDASALGPNAGAVDNVKGVLDALEAAIVTVGGNDPYVPFIQSLTAKTATFAAVLGETHIIDTSSGGFTANLPVIAGGQGRIAFYFVGTGGQLTLDPDSSETIGGKSTLKISQGHNTIENDGTEWKVVQRSGKKPERLDPVQITGNQNNYNPSDWGQDVTHIYIDSDASRTITGFEENGFTEMAQVIIVNDGSNDIVIAHDSGSSTANNRILVDGSADFTLAGNKCGILLRDGTVNKWRFFALTSSSSATSLQGAYDAQGGAQVTGGDNFDIAVTGAAVNIESTDAAAALKAGTDLTLGGRSATVTLNQSLDTALRGHADANAARTITSLIAALNNGNHVIAFKKNIDLEVAGTENLFAAPAGTNTIITGAYILLRTISFPLTTVPEVSFNWSIGGTAIPPEVLDGLDASGEVYRFIPDGVMRFGIAGLDTLQLIKDTLFVGGSFRVDVIVTGIVMDSV